MIKIEKSFFSFSHYIHYTIIKRGKSFFSFSYYFHYAMINRKMFFFFSFQHYIRYAMVTSKRNRFLLHHYFDYATIIKKISFLISLRRSLCKYLLNLTLLLTKNPPIDILPRKICVLKNFLPQEFQWSLT